MVLDAFMKMKAQGLVRNMLVMAKMRICYSVWPGEVEKWGLPLKVVILHGPNKDKRIDEEADLYLINYDGLQWLERKMRQPRYANKFDIAVADESTKIKHTNTKRFKALRKILRKFKRRYILTGTPSPRNLLDLFGQMYFVDLGETFGEYITEFRMNYFYPSGYQGYDWKVIPGKEEEIYAALARKTLYLPKELLELPPLEIVSRRIILPEEAMRVYRCVEEEFVAELEQGVINASNAGSKTAKLRQIASGAVYGTNIESLLQQEGHNNRHVIDIHDEKVEECIELVEELQGNPCLIAYNYRHELDKLRKAFPGAPYIGGGVSPKEGREIEQRWNRGEIPVLLGQISSIAHGLNLQESGSTIIVYSLTDNLEDYDQLIQRLWRQGQTSPVTVFNLIAEDTIDVAIEKLLKDKNKAQTSLLDYLKHHYLGTSEVKMNVIEQFIEITQEQGISLPVLGRNYPQGCVEELLNILANWSHDAHRKFLLNTIGKEATDRELISLYRKSRAVLLPALKVNTETLEPEDPELLVPLARKVVERAPIPSKLPDYLSFEPRATTGGGESSTGSTKKTVRRKSKSSKTKQESKSMSSKFASKKSSTTSKKSTAKKKAATPKKKVPTKKTAAKKKKTAAPKKSAVRSSNSSKKDQLLSMLKRASGVSVEEAAERLDSSPANIRSMIGSLRASGVKVQSLGGGVFKA